MTVSEYTIGADTAVLLRVHQSNFRVVGFSERPALPELAAIARAHDLPLVDDLGSGAFAPFEGEPSARESLAAGADLVCFSGDKLLGGPQAGIVVGRADLVERLRRHPLQPAYVGRRERHQDAAHDHRAHHGAAPRAGQRDALQTRPRGGVADPRRGAGPDQVGPEIRIHEEREIRRPMVEEPRNETRRIEDHELVDDALR